MYSSQSNWLFFQVAAIRVEWLGAGLGKYGRKVSSSDRSHNLIVFSGPIFAVDAFRVWLGSSYSSNNIFVTNSHFRSRQPWEGSTFFGSLWEKKILRKSRRRRKRSFGALKVEAAARSSARWWRSACEWERGREEVREGGGLRESEGDSELCFFITAQSCVFKNSYK